MAGCGGFGNLSHGLILSGADAALKAALAAIEQAVKQIVSGRLDRPPVHFEAPPPCRAGRATGRLPLLVRAQPQRCRPRSIAARRHCPLHPFDDGNGRLTRAITDLALAQSEQQAIRFYAMSASILNDRAGYYRILEASQKGTLDITAWLQWFLATLLNSLEQALRGRDLQPLALRYKFSASLPATQSGQSPLGCVLVCAALRSRHLQWRYPSRESAGRLWGCAMSPCPRSMHTPSQLNSTLLCDWLDSKSCGGVSIWIESIKTERS